MPDGPQATRNIGILAHIDAGKTSLTEAILYAAGAIRSPGSVDEGSTETDWMDLERERGITIAAAATWCQWRGLRITVLDTPGHVDFSAEVSRSLRVLDGLVMVVCGVAGVQAQTEAIWRACESRGLPRIAFINKLDRRGASFERVLADIGRQLGCLPLPLIHPVIGESGIDGFFDLVTGEYRANDAAGDPGSAPAGMAEAASAARRGLLEGLADVDDSIMEEVVHDRLPAVEKIRHAIRSACIAGRVLPVLGGSAFSGPSVSFLLDAIADYLPAPDEARPQSGFSPKDGSPATRRPSADERFSALVFKQGSFAELGRLSYVRIFSGRVKAGDTVWNASISRKERVSGIYRMRASRAESLAEAVAGDIVTLGGLKETLGGHSLSVQSDPILYEAIVLSEPIVSMALEPRSGSEAPLLSRALAEIVRDDPSLRVDEEADSGRLRLSGLGELHLEIALSRLQREFGLSPRSGAPEVALKESVSARACAEAVFDREIDYKRHYAKVRLAVSPGERGSGLSISSSVEATRRQTRVFSEAALRGASQVLETGPRFGYSATDIALELTGIEADPRDSSELAFEAAGAIAVRFAVSDAKPIILEPWMRLELGLPEEHLGLVIQALTGRQGRIEEIEDVPGGKVVSAVVAMRELFGLAGELRSRARGRIILSQAFHSFQAIPQHLYDRAASGKRVSG